MGKRELGFLGFDNAAGLFAAVAVFWTSRYGAR